MTTADYLEQLEQDREDLVDNLETKGITGLSGDETFTELVPEVLNIPSGGGTVEPEEKDVNFYDYDGTRVYSYTKAEFLQLESMPANPSHEGLTAQGWNWTLADAKTQVTTYNELDIGQLYKTDDDKTRIYITLTDKIRLSPYLRFYSTSDTTIEWGDGTTSTVTSGSKTTQHTYQSTGDYVIKISSNGNIELQGVDTNSSIILTYQSGNFISNTSNDDLSYLACIKKIELSSNCKFYNRALANCRKLEYITLHKDISSLPNYLFYYCLSLKSITIPSGITTIPQYCFNYCASVKHIMLPKSITTIDNYAFQYCSSLKRLTLSGSITSIGTSCTSDNYLLDHIILPNGITTLSQSAFRNNYTIRYAKMPSSISSLANNVFASDSAMVYYDFSESTVVPTLGNTNAIGGGSNTKIIVPDDLYEDWIVTASWSSWADKIIKKTDWDALNN